VRLTDVPLRRVTRLLAQRLPDPLTGLSSRSTLVRDLDRANRRNAAAGRWVGVLYIDVDDLKQVNDSRGHDAGDAVLVAFADALVRSVPPTARCARLGGDEFGVVLPRLSDADDALAVAEQVARLTSPAASVSIGAASAPAGSVEPLTLLRDADQALLTAKQDGGGRVRCAPTRAARA
jgi:diguanylate cyclase (GGDEF)-like protein